VTRATFSLPWLRECFYYWLRLLNKYRRPTNGFFPFCFSSSNELFFGPLSFCHQAMNPPPSFFLFMFASSEQESYQRSSVRVPDPQCGLFSPSPFPSAVFFTRRIFHPSYAAGHFFFLDPTTFLTPSFSVREETVIVLVFLC